MQHSEPIAEVWVCVDCMLARENDEHEPENGGLEPWAQLYGTDATANWDSESGDGMRTFDYAPCNACGSILHGSRYRYAVWAW